MLKYYQKTSVQFQGILASSNITQKKFALLFARTEKMPLVCHNDSATVDEAKASSRATITTQLGAVKCPKLSKLRSC